MRAGEVSRREMRAFAESRFPLLSQGEIWERLLDLNLDDLESERLCPEVQLLAQPMRLPDVPVHALVFSAFPHVANELYPLLVDAYVSEPDAASFQVVGIHEEWLTNSGFRRAIFFNEEDQGLIEADIEESPSIRSAQVLALNLREEQASHQRIEAALPNVPFSNPSAGTAKLDDKSWTGACWRDAGLPTPDFLVSDNATPEALQRFAAEHIPLVVKPVDGTEGRGVILLQSAGDLPALTENMLIMAERGNVRFAAEYSPVRCTVRLNVCWDGNRAVAESGYAQVAATADGIASAGRGGKIVPLPDLWSHLCRADGSPFSPGVADWRRICDLAAAGVTALAAALGTLMPRLAGIDLLLDIDEQDVLHPVLLEANGRPAGMCHSRYLTPDGPGDEPGVTEHLWKIIRNQITG